jgi:hypothetical protein
MTDTGAREYDCEIAMRLPRPGSRLTRKGRADGR